ncbi:hypothetical protein JCM11491_003178 [Sporobolomyces phaffii]
MATSYGAALPDSEPLVHSRLSAYLSLVPSFAQFLQAHTAESSANSHKLSSLIGTYRKQTAGSAADRGGAASTFEVGLAGVLEQLDLVAREQGIRADKEAKEVVSVLATVGSRLDAVRKKHHEHYKRLLAERDRTNEQRDKSKTAYYSACEHVESTRQKKQAAKEGRDADKATRNYDVAVEEMSTAKNQYLLDIDASNVAKDKLYNQHLPQLHDDYQLLEHSTTLQFVGLVDKLVAIQRESLERLGASVDKMKQELERVEPERDQQAFVDRWSATKLAAWEVPPDAVFEECAVWHDTDDFSTTPASVTYLQNVQLRASTKLSEVTPAFETKRREVSGLRNLREAYEQQAGLGDTIAVIENLFAVQHETTLLEISQTSQTSLIELASATLGDSASTGLRPHEFRPSHFVTPSTCAVCEGSVWGKGIKCEKCGMSVHAKKCEMKVPAGCTARPGAGVVRNKSRKTGAPAADTTPPSASMSTLSLNRSTSSAGSTSTVASSSAPPPRRTVPPPSSAAPAAASSSPRQSATLMYDYSAASAFELTVSEGETVSIIEPEDASGWTKVQTPDGREGLVPGSYLELSSSTSAPPNTATTPQQQVVALYDYAATTSDELSIQEGEMATVVGKGFDCGDGWAEVEIAARGRGIVPASYIQLV